MTKGNYLPPAAGDGDERDQRRAEILKGLAHPVRIAIAEMLREGELRASEIADHFSCDRTTTSKHLAVMRNLGILSTRREGPNLWYSLRMVCLVDALACVDKVLNGEEGCCKG